MFSRWRPSTRPDFYAPRPEFKVASQPCNERHAKISKNSWISVEFDSNGHSVSLCLCLWSAHHPIHSHIHFHLHIGGRRRCHPHHSRKDVGKTGAVTLRLLILWFMLKLTNSPTRCPPDSTYWVLSTTQDKEDAPAPPSLYFCFGYWCCCAAVSLQLPQRCNAFMDFSFLVPTLLTADRETKAIDG